MLNRTAYMCLFITLSHLIVLLTDILGAQFLTIIKLLLHQLLYNTFKIHGELNFLICKNKQVETYHVTIINHISYYISTFYK